MIPGVMYNPMKNDMKDKQEEGPVAFYARVQGRVQGVGFRYSAAREAARLRLGGWVRNASDGDVEVWAEGPREKLEVFLKWLHRGPQFSRVDRVSAEGREPAGYGGFGVKP
jgi:acylphosphatase